jgi:drug/metabolite transporter (DMT)-like permease
VIYSGLAAALWGGLYVTSQIAFADHIPPATLSALRLGLAVLALALVMRRPPRLRGRLLAGLGVLVTTTLLLQSYGTLLSGAATGSLLTLLTPVFVALLAPVRLGEKTSRLQWLGIAIGVAGAVVVIGPAGAGSVPGDALLVAASLSWAAFTVFGASLVRERGALEVTMAASTWALPLIATAAAVELALGTSFHVSPGGALVIGYLGLGATALGWWAWYRGVERSPAAAAALPFLLQPVVGVGLSAAFLGARLGPGFVLGGVLVAAGMLVASRR